MTLLRSNLFYLLCPFLILSYSGESPLNHSGSLENTLDSLATKNLFSGSVLVGIDTSVIFYHSTGFSQRKPTQTIGKDTRFEIASLTKQFTAAIILRLFEEKRIDLHIPFGQYLPWYPADYTESVTIHQLLTHQSGIPNYTNLRNWPSLAPQSFKKKNFVKLFADKPLEFSPGTDFSYSNSNYYLLGLIAEEITHTSFRKLLQKYIFHPLRMNQSDVLFEKKDTTLNIARGYEVLTNGYIEKAPTQHYSTAFSVSGIYSTPTDLFKWSKALSRNLLLQDSSKQLMFTPYSHGYGYGLVISKLARAQISDLLKHPFSMRLQSDSSNTFKMIWHWGSNPGFNTLFAKIPEIDATIIILENLTQLDSETPTLIPYITEKILIDLMADTETAK